MKQEQIRRQPSRSDRERRRERRDAVLTVADSNATPPPALEIVDGVLADIDAVLSAA